MLPFREYGSGSTTILLLHYFGGSRREWRHVIPHLSNRFRVITPDLAGFGEAWGLEGYSIEAMAARIDQLLRYLAPAPTVLVAHAMSGKAAMTVAVNPEDNLKALVLVNPSPLVPEPMSDKQREALLVANKRRSTAEAFVNSCVHTPLNAEDFEVAVDDVLRVETAAWRAWPANGSREDWSSRVPSLAVPTELIVGEHDAAIPLDFQQQHTLPLVTATGGSLHIIRDAGHLLPYECPQDLAKLIAIAAEKVDTPPVHHEEGVLGTQRTLF